ncbi:MFS transporter [Streptomyces sp. NPDC056580]|uniref:MFS transporter n=1 Tax=Streptomyces sp. NPDC056580 TaxID=3345872 RepID=UPI0036A411CD
MSSNSASAQTGVPSSVPTARLAGRTGIALTIIVVCQLMIVLDMMIVQIALPDMKSSLGLSTASMSWVINAYTLAFGGLLLLGGRAGDILGRRRVFLIGVAVFTLASFAGGLATEDWQLLAARAVQGAGGAMAAPNTLALIMSIFEEGPKRTRAIAMYSVVGGSGAAIGLILGGVLTDFASWRWVMFVNVPIGVAVFLLTPLFISETGKHSGRFDLAGALTSTAGMVALVYGVTHASESGWTDTSTLVAFALAVVLLPSFVAIERTARQPVVSLKLFLDRTRASSYIAMLLIQGSMIGMLFFLSQYVQQIFDYSPLTAGLCFLPVAAVLVPVAGMVTKLVAQVGSKVLVIAGAVLLTGANWWLSRLDEGSSYWADLLPPMLIFGVGMALATIPPTMLALSGVAPEESGSASSVLNAIQQVGGSLGLAVLVTVFTEGGRRAADDVTPGQDPSSLSDRILVGSVEWGFVAATCFAAATIVVALFFLSRRQEQERAAGAPEQAPGAASVHV